MTRQRGLQFTLAGLCLVILHFGLGANRRCDYGGFGYDFDHQISSLIHAGLLLAVGLAAAPLGIYGLMKPYLGRSGI